MKATGSFVFFTAQAKSQAEATSHWPSRSAWGGGRSIEAFGSQLCLPTTKSEQKQASQEAWLVRNRHVHGAPMPRVAFKSLA